MEKRPSTKTSVTRGMNKIIIVTRKTRLSELVQKYNTLEQAKFYIEHLGADFSDYVLEDRNYTQAVAVVKSIAEKYARIHEVDRTFLPNLIIGRDDIVITVGQDGMVANVMKYLDGHPLIGVNPDVKRWDGVLLPFEPRDLAKILPAVLAGKYNAKEVTMAKARTKDGQEMLAVNDLFIGQKTHTSAQYDIFWNDRRETQSSSGIIISTGLGATGWYKSILSEAQRIAEAFGVNDRRIAFQPMSWSCDRLTFVVREPYPSRSTQADIVFGSLAKTDTFCILSKMSANGVIFSDGMEQDALEFNAGSEITVGIAEKKGNLVV
ncbi:MAG: hypothetical protein NC086_07760 [Alistipes sp.]|nr:hypothetical protein [Alistipes sp.]